MPTQLPLLRTGKLPDRNDKGEAVDYKLELVIVPVSDVDRSKSFYLDRAGFELLVDHRAGEDFRVVQLTPTGSACAIAIGTGIGSMEAGSLRGLHLMVTDIDAARDELVARGVEVGEIRHMKEGAWSPGVDPTHGDYTSFADFADPDGNTWVLQERGFAG
jgi:catechol 2,3-dioxygenase-like lactoylglutathione lyase family enzyme